MDNNVRKRVYDVLLSKTGYKDSFEDFNKFMDTDNGAREKVYGVLRDKTGYKDSLEDFNEFMGGGLKDDAVSPQRRPSLREQVNKPQFPVMEELPWMNNTKDRNDALYYTNESEKRIANSFKKGDFEPFSHKEEDTRVNEQYTAKKVGNESDIIENARNRFSLTERGYELDNELSTIQEEKTNKYLEEFKKSKEYQEMAGKQIRTREEADVTNKAINDLFAQRYGETINKEMQPYNDAYRNEVFSRYGVGIKDDLTKLGKKNTSNQVADLTQEVNFMLDKHHESLKQHGGSGNNAMNALMGSTQYNQATGEQRRDIGALESAHRLLERSQEIINEAGKKGNTNFVEGLGRGLRDNFDADKWTMGLAEMADAKYLNNALEKSERGEPLTPIEEKLLEASTINMVTQAYFGSDLGRGYKAGQVTAESLPFMMEFIVNPISGSGNVIARKLLSYGMRRFGRSSSKAARMTLNAFGNALKGKNARIAGRLIGDSAAALGMEGTTGVGHVAAGTLDRLNQNYETSFDDNGEVQVDKVGNMGLGEAFARSGASRFFENQSEMIFNAFRGGSKVAKEAVASVAPGMSGKTVNKLVDFYDKIRNNKTFQSVTDRAQFHGILEEYGEEVYNNIANVAIGEMSLEDATDIDSNIDTFLGLAPTSLAFAALGIGGLVHENTKAKNRLRKFVSELDEGSRVIFDELWTEVEKGNNDIAKAFVKKTLGDNSFTPEQKKERVFSVKDMINARDTEQVVNEADGTEEVADVADETASTPIDKVNVYRDFVRADRKAKQVLPEEIISQLPSVTDVESFIAEKNLNDVQKEAANAYSNAFGLFSEYQGDVLKRRQEVANTTREQAIDDVERIANQDTGSVVQVKHKFLDNPVYLVGGRLSFGEDGLLDIENSDDRVYYLDEDGNRKMAPAHDFDSVLSDDMKEDVIGMRLQDADQQFIQEEEAALSTPDIPAPERGDRVVINGDTYLIEEQDIDVPGGVLAVKLDTNGAIDVNNGRQVSLSADEYYSAKEAELWGEQPKEEQSIESSEDASIAEELIIMLQNEVENDSAALSEEINVSQGEEVLEENAPSIPSDDKGNLLYHRAPVEVTIDAINREELEPDEIDSFVSVNKEASAKLVSNLENKPPKMGTSIAKYKADKLAWSDRLSDAKAQVEYWDAVGEEIAVSRVQPGDKTAEAILSMGEPLTGEELAAAMLGTGRLPVLYDSYKKETGGRNAEARGMVGLFASKTNGGMTIEEAGEQLMLADQENGTNFFDPNDPNAGRNAIIEVLSGSRTRGDLFNYIQRNREQMAERERQAEYDAYSSWTEDNFGMAPEDYEAYEEQAPASIAERFKDFDEEDFYNNIANELNEEQREVAGVAESSEVLQGEGIVSPERIETSNDEGGAVPVGSESGSEDGAVLEEARVDNQDFGTAEVENTEVSDEQSVAEVRENEQYKFSAPQLAPGESVLDYVGRIADSKRVFDAEQEVDANPTNAQKEAGNYKKGHVRVDSYDISIENPKGSERSGVGANGQPWNIIMNNSYGYIRRTEGADGDHIDVFLSDSPSSGNVFIVDQKNEDGSFDEHKVMYGFSSVDEARDAYLANYSPGWKGLGTITEVSKEDFNKWIDSSKRKTKPFSEYKIAEQPLSIAQDRNTLVSEDRYTELKKRMQEKLRGQMNIGIDPEILAIGTEMAVYHIEKGSRKFADYAKEMIKDLGDAIRPYLKSFYNGVRDLPEMDALSREMDLYDDVSRFDMANFDKSVKDIVAMSEQIVKESAIDKQVAEVKKRNIAKKSRKTVSSQREDTPAIMQDLFNQNVEENGPERGSEEADSRLGETQREEAEGVQGRRMDRSRTEDIRPNEGRSRGVSNVPATESRRDVEPSEKKNLRNNRNERGKDYAPTSVKARFDANIAAIRLMRELTDRAGIPKPAEMKILRRYSGWGGLGTFFNNEHTVEGQMLRELLGEEEYDAAVMSINSAYYTPATVTDSLWAAAEQLGFKGGAILEGSAGIGNILGAMPEGISERSAIEAIEIDNISGNILKLLYPDAKVHVQGFQDTNIKNGSVDLAITNVPFVTGLHVYDKIDKDLSRKFKNIHDFCIAKNIRKLSEGGIGIFITSNGTLDKSRTLREWITGQGKADVIGAFRLNNETFGGTNATSDIIIVQKRIGNQPSAHAIDVLNTSVVRTGEYETGESRWDKKLGRNVKETKPVVMEYNSYFVQHPENMAGEMAFAYEKGDTFRPGSVGLYPMKGQNQQKMLRQWVENMLPIDRDRGLEISEQTAQRMETTEKEGSLLLNKDGELCVSQRGEAVPIGANKNKVKGYDKSECLGDYNAIKLALDEVLQYQVTNEDDSQLKPLLKKLNRAYDSFIDKYGPLNRNTSISFLKNDVDFPSISALEDYRETKGIGGEKSVTVTKTNVFNGRVIGYKAEPTPTTVKDGVIASVYKYGSIDLGYIADKLEKDKEQVKNEILNERIGFVNPITGGMDVRYEYLSGNVREKMELAKANNAEGEYSINIEELEKVIPMDIPAHLIEFSLGSSWIEPQLYQQFLSEEFGVDSKVEHVEGAWIMKLHNGKYTEKNRQAGVYSKMFDTTIYGDELVGAALNNRTIGVKRIIKNSDGSTETLTDKDATQTCNTRIAEIKDSFKEWARGKMQQDEALAEKMMRVYNDKFNAIVPKSIDDMFLPERFGGAAESVNLYPHQKKSVIRGTTEPLMLAHEVGTGKTFTLISTAMEMRRIGTAKKPMIVVQNATVGQFVSEAKKLYPNARILTLSERDRTPEGRKAFYGKIKYSDWDMIVVPQSTFEMIPDSPERQMTFIRERIDDKMHALEAMRESGADEQVINGMEKELDALEIEFATVASGESATKKDAKGKAKAADNASVKAREQLDRRTDDVQYFDEMGVDAILVDEAHEYKRLGFATMMTRGVKGIDPAGSKKSAGVYLKTRTVLEQNGWKNVVFATGTPISNTAAELWTFMKYLMPKEVMVANEIYYFDDFVRNFGSISQSLEFATNGKFKENTRFAAYINKPELVRLWASVSDTVLTKEVNYVNDKVPEMESEKAQDIFLPQSDGLIDIMRAVRKRLDEFEKMSGKEKRANSSIPLTMYGIAKRAAIDTRLVDKDALDDLNSKTNRVVKETLRSLSETDSYKGTVAIFCDNQRRWDGKVIGFDLFDDMKNKLVEKGVPQEQIVIMKSGMSISQKEKIFADVNAGNVRVIIGNTQTLGTGVNIQERLHTLVHMDAPDRPMDYTQRNGRILRQGNLHKPWNKSVRILRFGVEDSLDVTSYQRLKTKAGFIDSIMDGKGALANNQENRTLEEEEEGLFDNPVAVLSGSQYALLKNQAEREYRKYANKKAQYEADQIYITNRLRRNEGKIKANLELIEDRKEQVERLERLFPDMVAHEVKIAGKTCRTDAEIDSALRELVNKPINEKAEAARKNVNYQTEKVVVKLSLDGVDVNVHVRISRESIYDNKVNSFRVAMHKDVNYSCEELGLKDVSVSGGYVRNALDDLVENVVSSRDARESMDSLVGANAKMMEENDLMKERNGKSFGYEKELKEAGEKVEEYTALMRKELEEKEAKYADRGSDSVELDVIESESILEEDIETRYGLGEFSLDQERGISIEKAMVVVSKFETQVKNHPHISLVESEADIEQLKEYGVKDQVIDDLKMNAWGNESVIGVYIDSAKIMVMFPSHARNEEHLESFMWHENVHYAISNMGIGDRLTNSCLDFVKNKYNDIYENIVNQYLDTPDVWAEESVAYLVQEMLEQKGANKLLNAKFAGSEDISNLFTQLFNFINDGTRRKYNQFRRGTNKDGGTENEVQGDDGNGIRVGKSLERNREEEGATRSEKDRPDSGGEVIRFHDTQNEEESSDGTIGRYEEELKKQAFKAKEAYQDSMLALKKLQEVIEEHSGEKLKGSENAYMAENHMSSKSTHEAEMYGENFFKPMLVAVGNLMKAGASHTEIIDYMMAKHGLERNEVFAMRDAEIQASKRYDEQISDLQREYDEGHLQEDEFEEKSDALKIEKTDFIEKQYLKNRKNDYSGLSSLTGEEDYEAVAKEMVDAFEENFDSTPLWDKVNAATKETLRKSYESGMMSKSTHEKVKNQFKYYIPLRGWNEKTAADVYEYFNSEVSPVNSVLKSAKGRTSVADDPLAVIGNMAESTILQGNRNMMKQRFMNMAINHPSDLLSISEAWYVIDPSTGEWTISYPRIEEADSADVIAQKVEAHENRMLEMQRDGEATRVNEKLNIDYRISDNQAKEHIVSVKRNGKDYLIYVNGNPRAAQAVNGLTNPDAETNKVLAGVSKINRQLAANFTARNPAFVVSNLARDLIFSTSAVFVKEDPIYAIRYTANIPKAMKIALQNISGKAKDEIFEEFLANGGETGYTALHNIDEYKRMIKKELGEITGKTDYFKHVKACAHFFSMINRWAEDVSRFNAFMTSRELGRTVSQSIHDAKEVTVNFNKKGSGYKTGGAFGLSAGIFRNFYLFFNAAVQSLANFGRLAQKNKTGFGIMIGGFTAAGFIVPVLNTLAISLLGDDDDYYNNLSEWERRNNLCIYIGNGSFLKIPLPIELRAFYGLGEMAYQETIGNGSNGKDIAYKAINQMTELLPINPLGNNGDLATTLMPDVLKPFWQINENMDFMGKPIYRDNSFNKTMPEWTKAYRGTSKWLINLSEWNNELAGGDKYKTAPGLMNWNPAKVEHLFESYFGGMATTINQTGKTLSAGIKSIIDGEVSDDFILRNMPVINRFASDAKDDRTSFGKINTRYFELYNQYEETKKNLNGYIKEASKGDIGYLNKLSELQNSKEYDTYKVFDLYQKQINKIKKAEKQFADDSKNKTLQGEIAKLKKELIKRIEGI